MTRLTPFTRYEMDVRCKIETSNYWSEPLHKSFKTLPEGKFTFYLYSNILCQ